MQTLIIRSILGIAFAVILSRAFFPNSTIEATVTMSIFLVGMAYVSEYFHNKRS